MSEKPAIFDTLNENPVVQNGGQKDSNSTKNNEEQIIQQPFQQPMNPNWMQNTSSRQPQYGNQQFGMNFPAKQPSVVQQTTMQQTGMQALGAQQSFGMQQFVMHQPPLGMHQPPLGMQQSSLGMPQTPFVVTQSPFGMSQPPPGMLQPPFGMSQFQFGMQPGMQQQPPGITQLAFGMSQPSSGMQQQPPLGISQPSHGIQQPPTGMQQILPGIQQPQTGMQQLGDNQQKEIEILTNQINSLNEEKNRIEKDSKNLIKENTQLKNELQDLTTNLKEVEEKLNQKEQQLQQSKKDQNQNERQLKEKITDLEIKINEEEKLNQTNQAEIKKLNTQISNQKDELQKMEEINRQYQNTLNQMNQKDEVSQLRRQNQDFQNQIKQKDILIAEKDKLVDNLKSLKSKENEGQQVISKLQTDLFDLSGQINQLTQENKHLLGLKNQIEEDKKNLMAQLELFSIEIQSHKKIIEYLKACLDEANQQCLQNTTNNSNDQTKVQEQLRQIKENRETKIKREQESYNLERERILQKHNEEQQKQKQLNALGKQKMVELIRKASSIQCCFVIDLFKSNEKTANAIIKATETCCELIKKTTNRESSWGAVCYGYQHKNFMLEYNEFSNSSDVLSGFFKKQKYLKDQKDEPENLKAALKKMLELNWSEKYRLAIVIANSPCHGKKYHHPKKYSKFFFFSHDYDRKPDDDMEDIIKEIVKKDIVLLVIRFNDETKVMCSELEKLYSKLNYPQLFHTLSVKSLDQKNSDVELASQIQKMAAFIIGTDNKMTKTKINQQIRMQNFEEGQNDMKNLKEDVVIINNEVEKQIEKQEGQKKENIQQNLVQNALEDKLQYDTVVERVKKCTDGALEALCRKGDISKFENIVKCENFSCKVYKVELKQESFQKKLENIEQIKFCQNDFDLKLENDWQCVRTQNPFAYGMMKAVYLMKKRNNTEEIYVVKIPIDSGPYQTKEQAVNDCRSHLIAKNLMKDFMQEIMNKNQGIQMVQYTDFLLLEENETKYWIAERFFKGNFEKYNNNDGFISDAQTYLNTISQAFSYFTYQKSSYSFIINDIQGVGTYFTDPAINTIKGNFDDTDVGEDGISSYLSTLQMKKHICEGLLKSIDIEID